MSKKLGIIKFGKQLLKTGDLDPIYIMLHRAEMHENRLKRWMLAYWFFYHAGVASKLSGYRGSRFFEKAIDLAQSKAKTPRGTERRHFRGEACIKSLEFFHEAYSNPEDAVDHVTRHAAGVQDVLLFVKKRWPLFGPWIGFKIADMLERLDLREVEFSPATLEMYSEPTKGAELVAQKYPELWSDNQDDPPPSTTEVVELLMKKFRKFKAPPRYERPVNAQEVETILCKWKSHLSGHYPMRKDTKEIYHALKGWGEFAEHLQSVLATELFDGEDIGVALED